MRHTVEIADSQGKTMQLSVYVNEIGSGGSWRAIEKGMIRYNSGPVRQVAQGYFDPDTDLELMVSDGRTHGIKLIEFISWDTVNDQGTGYVVQPWVIGLTPGNIDWSIV